MITLFRLLRKLVLVKSSRLRIRQKNKIYSFIFTKLDNFFVIYRSGSGKNCFYSSLNQHFRCVGKRKEAVAVCNRAFQIRQLSSRSTKWYSDYFLHFQNRFIGAKNCKLGRAYPILLTHAVARQSSILY